LTELWGIPLSSLAVSYIDSAGDRCVLSSDEELRDFYDEVRGEGKEKDVVKMRVVVLERAEDQEVRLSSFASSRLLDLNMLTSARSVCDFP
jgi:hypothetical protein